MMTPEAAELLMEEAETFAAAVTLAQELSVLQEVAVAEALDGVIQAEAERMDAIKRVHGLRIAVSQAIATGLDSDLTGLKERIHELENKVRAQAVFSRLATEALEVQADELRRVRQAQTQVEQALLIVQTTIIA